MANSLNSFFRRTLHATVLLALAAGADRAMAACGDAGTPCGAEPAPASQDASGPVSLGVGNPIHIASGNKYQREVDLPALPGVLGLEIVRHYNSSLSAATALPGAVGRGWRLSYETTLAVMGNTIAITQADGSTLAFGRDLIDQTVARHHEPARGVVSVRAGKTGDEYLWTWTDGRKLSFNTRGHLVQIQAASGEILSMQYDARGLLVSVTDPQGRSLRLAWLDKESARAGDRFRGVQSIDSPVGRFDYAYGSALPKGALPNKLALLANLVGVSYPATGGVARSGRRYHYEDGLHLTLLTGISIEGYPVNARPTSVRYATYAYRGDGKAVLSTHAGNANKVTLDYGVPNQTTVTNSLGQKTVYRHTIIADEYRLLEVRGMGCATCGEPNMRYAYDKQGRLNRAIRLDNDGRPSEALSYQLDAQGRTVGLTHAAYVKGQAQAPTLQARYDYTASGALSMIERPSVVPGKMIVTRRTYNSNGQLVSTSESGWSPLTDGKSGARPIFRTVSYAYRAVNGRSLLSKIDGPLPNGRAGNPADSDVTVFQWDASGNALTTMTTPGNFTSKFSYDQAGRMAAVTDHDNHVTSFTYSARGQQLNTSANGVTRVNAYDAAGNLAETSYSGPDRAVHALMRFGFDTAGRQIWTLSRLGILEQLQYDTEGNVLESSKESATFRQVKRFAYDERGNLLAARDENGGVRQMRWNAQNLPDLITDAMGRQTRLQYGADGALVQASSPADAGQALKLESTANDGVNILAPSGARTRYVKDDFGRTVAIDSADSGLLSRSYDLADRIVASRDAAGNRAIYEYDVAGRIVLQTVTPLAPAKPLVTRWAYHGKRMVLLEDPEQTERYAYDISGRLASRSVTIKLDNGTAVTNVTRYTYDQIGQVESESLPDGSFINYKRNGQNQVVALERGRVRTPWLRWMLPAKPIASQIESDLVGIKQFSYGNGIEALYQRSAQGALARIVYRKPAARSDALKIAAAGALEGLLGVTPAYAAAASPGPVKVGALGLPEENGALLDHRFLWDIQGNLLHKLGKTGRDNYAYDDHDRLIASATTGNTAQTAGARFSRYHYDGAGNRLLGQEDIDSQDDTSHTRVSAYAPGTNRWLGDKDAEQQTHYDAVGQPTAIGQRSYAWNVMGKLVEVRNANAVVASYRYNHRGERISKAAGQGRSYFLYDGGKVQAELDEQGRVARQYIYLAGQPVAIVDGRTALGGVERSALMQVFSDIGTAVGAWFASPESLRFLHNNHLGAPEVATDMAGQMIWQAAYTPFGRLVGAKGAYAHNLRLPGQYEDAETGLYYNHHRYYDPQRGQYLTPDPLGLRAGINTYAYVSGNPLKYVDPDGLILFAFDGTNNSNPPISEKLISNVVKFYDAYDEDLNGEKFYITGINTTNADMSVRGDLMSGAGFDERVALGFKFLDDFIAADTGTDPIQIDVIGFSRGAAEARVWINKLVGKLQDGKYTTGGRTRCINLRFEGLWDTVPHLGLRNEHESRYDFSIPTQVKLAVHAVGLNENRGGLANFNVHSITGAPATASTSTRIEKGFIGAHSDIGGGYKTGDLSDVTLMWMIGQAGSQGIKFKDARIVDNGWNIVTNPIVHDPALNFMDSGNPTSSRDVVFRNSRPGDQRTAVFDGRSAADTRDLINYFNNPFPCAATEDVGIVDMAKYQVWLTSYGLTMPVGPLVRNRCS